MGRPRKYANDAERKAADRVRKTIKRTDQEVKRTSIWHTEISQDRFKGVGRGIPVDGYVLVSLKSEPNGNTLQAVVSHADWTDRLDKVCAHGLAGWSCKECLPA
jgi:hypothetical protein